MHDAAASFVKRQAWPDGDGAFVMSRDELRALMERAYCGGYASGRMSRAAVKQESGT